MNATDGKCMIAAEAEATLLRQESLQRGLLILEMFSVIIFPQGDKGSNSLSASGPPADGR